MTIPIFEHVLIVNFMKNMILASTSTVFGSGYLEYLQPELREFLKGVDEILFIPYARPGGISYDMYTSIAKKGFESLGKKVVGIHTSGNPQEAISKAQAIFVGGGNTFVLVDTLYNEHLMDVLKDSIDKGIPYLGCSAGSNIAGISMQTTNDMPIVYPKSYQTIGAVPFNINAHYIEPSKDSTHKGETRATRIKEYHCFHDTPVVGLREGSWLKVDGNLVVLKGNLDAPLFRKGKDVCYYPDATVFSDKI